MNNNGDINTYVPSILNPRTVKKNIGDTLTQNSIISRCSLSLKRKGVRNKSPNTRVNYIKANHPNKENSLNSQNIFENVPKPSFKKATISDIELASLGYSAIEDLSSLRNIQHSPLSCGNVGIELHDLPDLVKTAQGKGSVRTLSSATELGDCSSEAISDKTLQYDVEENPVITVSFGVTNCSNIDVKTRRSNIKRVLISQEGKNTNIDCDIVEISDVSTDCEMDENMIESVTPSPPKRSCVTINLDVKKKKLSSQEDTEKSKVLILNTNAIEKVTHVIVQPPNFGLVKKHNTGGKLKSGAKTSLQSSIKNGRSLSGKLIQKSIASYLCTGPNVLNAIKVAGVHSDDGTVDCEGAKHHVSQVMSKNSCVGDAFKCEHIKSHRGIHRENVYSPSKSSRAQSGRNSPCNRAEIKHTFPDSRNDSARSHSPRKKTYEFNLATKSNKVPVIPNYKLVAGTHFAVDAFSYGEIPNVENYFLTHFHTDHYSGLKKSFNKTLYCSKITADLCISRLCVNPKCIRRINIDETIKIDDMEITAVDANHCPGAIMLVFTLPNGKTLLHTGDFRASPLMESYPVFWNKEIHTIYLDTTYCNPRYDFPTQDQSLEMALCMLRQKKMALEKSGKKFSSVLIVCGTYTIGKEKFFLGLARRVGCGVWACPEKDRVLQAVEGRSFSRAPPVACQLHVVPMKDLTHEKLRCYLDSLQGAFNEVVAFKPSGWENGKNSSIEKDNVTIHGIPYSEHSSFSEMIRFVKFLKPKQVMPTVDISGGVKAVQKYFPCPLINTDENVCQSKLSDFFSIPNRPQVPAVT